MSLWQLFLTALESTPVPLERRAISGEDPTKMKMPKDYEGKKEYKRMYYAEYYRVHGPELVARKRERRRKAAALKREAKLNQPQGKETNHATS